MNDLIDRQGAIDAIENKMDLQKLYLPIEFEEILRELPSAELGMNLAKVGTWTYRNGEPLTGGVCEGDIIYCSRCHKPTHVKIHTWIENGMKYGKAINVRECPNCGARME